MISLDDATLELVMNVKLIDGETNYIATSGLPGGPSYDLALVEIVEDKIGGHTWKRCWVAWGGDADDLGRVAMVRQAKSWREGALMGRPVQFQDVNLGGGLSLVVGLFQ